MSNMLDYIIWRGDLSFDAAPVNPVDGLILAQLSMMRWETALAPGGTATVKALVPDMHEPPVSVGFTVDNDVKLLEAAARSERFGTIEVSDYIHHVNRALEIQFAAVALKLSEGSVYVSFRGTDTSLVGWKEDCKLAFSKPVPAQKAAKGYLAKLSRKYPGPLWVGGHSKGGNLAMYAAAMVDEPVRARIASVFNYDGPGLSDHMNAQALYARLQGKLFSFVPQGSVVGLLLAHPEHYTVVRSNSISLLQHDPYSWQVEGPAFVTQPELSRDSARFDSAFRRWLDDVSEADRELLIETLFGVLDAIRAPSFGPEFWQALARNPGDVMAAIKQTDPEDKKRVSRMLRELTGYMVTTK